MNPVLDLDTRRAMYRLVCTYPGLHVREVARQMGTSVALVEYHLAILAEHGLVRSERDGNLQRLFAADAPVARGPFGLLRKRIPLHVVLTLLDAGPLAHGKLAERLGLSKSKLSFHLRKMEAVHVVRRGHEGTYELVDARGALRFLVEQPPTPDLLQEFAEVWSRLYGKP